MYHVERDGDILVGVLSLIQSMAGSGHEECCFYSPGNPCSWPVFIIENVSLPYVYITAVSMVISKFSLPEDSDTVLRKEFGIFITTSSHIASFMCLFIFSFLLM